MKKLLERVRRYLFRSAKTGRYVSKDEAERHPTTTVRESAGWRNKPLK